jgi:hypothetical protein
MHCRSNYNKCSDSNVAVHNVRPQHFHVVILCVSKEWKHCYDHSIKYLKTNMLDIKIHANFGHITIGIHVIYRRYINLSLSRCPCGVRRRPESARLLGSRVRIPLRVYMFVSCVLCCVGSGLCDELITR